MKKRLIIHPILFASYPIIFMYANNIKTLWLSAIIVPLFTVICVTLVLFIGINRLVKNINKSSLIVSILVIIILSYGHIFDYLRTTVIDKVLMGKQPPFFLFVFPLAVISCYVIIKRKKNSFTVSFFNAISSILIVFPLFQIFSFTILHSSNGNIKEEHPIEYKATTTEIPADKLPDIYYFIFDRYARSDTLKDVYQFDNSEFLDYLVKKGFYIPANSWANYTQTHLSLASSLNMEYLDNLSTQLGEESGDVRPLSDMIEEYEVWRFLKSRGYYFIHAGSWWAPTTFNRYADKNINIPSLSEFSEIVYSKTIFYPLTVKLNIPIFNNRLNYWKRPLYQFTELEKIPDMHEPTYTFVHFLITHEPFVFDKNGVYLSEEEISSKDAKQNYREQVIFTNKKLEELIDIILAESGDNPPIIILQADEGPFPDKFGEDEQNYDWNQASEDDMREKMAILNAYYLPDGGNTYLSDYITPVNTFRLIFNYYFGQNLELLPNISYLSNKGKPYKFIKIVRYPQ